MKGWITLISALLFTGCSLRIAPAPKGYVNILKPSTQLDNKLSVFIVYPNNYSTNVNTFEKSSKLVGDKIKTEFQNNNIATYYSDSHKQLDEAFALAKNSNTSYLILSHITKWDDHVPGNILGQLDKGEIILSIYDVQKNELLHQALIGGEGTSTTVNFIPMGTHGPEDCLTQGLASWRSTLYGEKQFQ